LNKIALETKVPVTPCSGFGNQILALPFHLRGSKTGAAMWMSLLALAAAVLLPAIVVIGLFRLAALKRPDDLKPPPQGDEWASSRGLQTPK
jgi:hypothetical protein